MASSSTMMLISLIIAVLLFLMNKKPKTTASSIGSSSSSGTSVETQSIARAQAPSVVKREVTCDECLKPKTTTPATTTTTTVAKCDDCLVKPGMACLKQHFDSKNVRAVSWTDLFNRMNEISEKIVNIIELGTSPLGEKSCIDTGCSTVLFAQWVKNRNDLYSSRKNISVGKLYSIDSVEKNIQQAKTTYGKYPEIMKNIQFSHHEKMVDFISSFDKPIDILYIDGNSVSDKRAHLAEIRAALPRLSKHALVVIDNIKLGHGDLVIQELATKGFKILSDDFQAIITKPVITDSVKNEISRMSEWMAESKKF
jgi:predicted O-methyltransferase YrrM